MAVESWRAAMSEGLIQGSGFFCVGDATWRGEALTLCVSAVAHSTTGGGCAQVNLLPPQTSNSLPFPFQK